MALALATAASPLPLAVMVVLLLTPRAVVNGMAFLAGWATALLLLGACTVAVVGSGARLDEDGPAVSGVEVVLGTGLLVLGVTQWRRRGRAGTDAGPPGWLQVVDRWTGRRAFAMGVLVLAVSPKNVALTVTASGVVAAASERPGDGVLPLAAFIALGSAGLALPLALRICMGPRAAGLLRRWRGRLLVHGPPVACGSLVLLGGLLVARGAG